MVGAAFRVGPYGVPARTGWRYHAPVGWSSFPRVRSARAEVAGPIFESVDGKRHHSPEPQPRLSPISTD
jgi:hypothetical protein